MPTSTFHGIANNTHHNWWQDPSLRKNVFFLCVCGLFAVYSGYDGSLLNGLQALPKFFEEFPELEDASTLGMTGAAQFLPGLLAPLIVSPLADRLGRRIPMIMSLVGIIIGAVIQATSKTHGQFIASRVIIGLSGKLGLPVSSTALVEIAHPRLRSIASALNLCSYYIGSIISSWATFGTLSHFPNSSWSWRLPSLLQALVPVLIVVPTCMLPESPRFLVSKGRIDDARRTLAQQHANGIEDDPLVIFELESIEQAVQDERSASNGKPVGWMDFLRTKGNRWRLFIVINVAVGAQWNGVGIVSYYLVPILRTVGINSATQQTLVTGGLSISNLVFAVVGAFLVERMGRRPLWFISTGGMLVCLAIVTALSATFVKNESATVGGTVIAFLYLFYGAYCLAWTPLNIAYPVEVLSFSLRAKGMSLWAFFASLALCLNTWLNPIALTAIAYWYYIVYIGVLVYLLFVEYFFFPETKGLSLEEVALRFDGPSGVNVDDIVTERVSQFKAHADEKAHSDEKGEDDRIETVRV